MSSIRSRLASEGGKTSDWPGAAKLRILLIGSGGREHALTWRLEQSDLVDQIFVAPGNGGTALGLKTVNVNVPIDAFDDLADFATGANVSFAEVTTRTCSRIDTCRSFELCDPPTLSHSARCIESAR